MIGGDGALHTALLLLLVVHDELSLGVPFLYLVHVAEPHVRHEEPDEGTCPPRT